MSAVPGVGWAVVGCVALFGCDLPAGDAARDAGVADVGTAPPLDVLHWDWRWDASRDVGNDTGPMDAGFNVGEDVGFDGGPDDTGPWPDAGALVACETIHTYFSCTRRFYDCFPYDPAGDRGPCDRPGSYCENFGNCRGGGPGHLDYICQCRQFRRDEHPRWNCRLPMVCPRGADADAGPRQVAEDVLDASR